MKPNCDKREADKYLFGQMDSQQEQSFRLHLSCCPFCKQYIEDAQKLTDEFLDQEAETETELEQETEEKPSIYLQLKKIILPTISAIAAAVVLGWLIMYPKESTSTVGQKEEPITQDSLYKEALPVQIEESHKASSFEYPSDTAKSHEN